MNADQRTGKTLLLIEDDAVTRLALEAMFAKRGFAVTGVSSAEDALAYLRGNLLPALILLDLGLPGMSGWEFLERQRRDPALSSIPVVILSATTRPEGDPDRSLPYFQKPVEGEQLAAVVESLALVRPEVLVVEDEGAIRKMLEIALRHHGFEVRLARGGQDAVALYQKHHARIALVLMDVQMPGLDGPGTLTLLRAIEPNVRCCFMSGNTGEYSAEELLALGASHVLPKPFHSLAAVASLLWGLARAE